MWSVLQADAAFDPIPQYVYLGDSIEDGLFAWIQIGINSSADYTTDDYYGVGKLNLHTYPTTKLFEKRNGEKRKSILLIIRSCVPRCRGRPLDRLHRRRRRRQRNRPRRERYGAQRIPQRLPERRASFFDRCLGINRTRFSGNRARTLKIFWWDWRTESKSSHIGNQIVC